MEHIFLKHHLSKMTSFHLPTYFFMYPPMSKSSATAVRGGLEAITAM